MHEATVTLYHGDCLDILSTLADGSVDAVITDPPYGIKYSSGSGDGHHRGTSLPGIVGDDDTTLRDYMIEWAGSIPMLVFGSWKRLKPQKCHTLLTWDKGIHVGMGNLSIPWKPNTEEIYVIGSGFCGKRGSSVLSFNAPVTWNSKKFGRKHPHEKPVSLIIFLIEKLPRDATILDPFMGSGTTGVACVQTGRNFIGIEIDEGYYDIAKKRITEAKMQPRLVDA